mgnify:CR=1 FL=1
MPTGVFPNKIHSAFSDRQGNLWMCTHSKGLEKITFQPSLFSMITPEPHRYESLSNEVRALCEDARHNLWVGLKDGKLRVYDKNRTEYGYLTETGVVSRTGTPLMRECLFYFSRQRTQPLELPPRRGLGKSGTSGRDAL